MKSKGIWVEITDEKNRSLINLSKGQQEQKGFWFLEYKINLCRQKEQRIVDPDDQAC